MGWITLEAADGHRLRAWQAQPAGSPRGALVVLQEIFGANAHIRDLCDRHAREGWLAIAPSLFDRAGGPPDGLGYTPEDVAAGRELKGKVAEPDALLDVLAAVDHVAAQGLPVVVIGFCWGGTLAWLAAARLDGVAGAVAYYGTGIAANVGETPRVPVLLHFGERDANIPQADVDAIEAAHPGLALHRYPAGHGFNCDARAAYDAACAQLAGERTEALLRQFALH